MGDEIGHPGLIETPVNLPGHLRYQKLFELNSQNSGGEDLAVGVRRI